LVGAGYKGKLHHFEISVKLRISTVYIDLLEEKKLLTLFRDFYLFWPQNTHFRAGTMKIKKNTFSTLEIQISIIATKM
jgi:hypothetical protein